MVEIDQGGSVSLWKNGFLVIAECTSSQPAEKGRMEIN